MRCARQEFLEKGFMKASLRNICKNAEVTTGALYFFFRDKDDLFCSLFQDILQQIGSIIDEHYEHEAQSAVVDLEQLLNGSYEEEYILTERIIELMYARRDDVLLILTKAQGSSAENLPDTLIAQMDAHNRMLADAVAHMVNKERISDDVIHWISHSQMDMFIFMVVHIPEKEAAKVYARSAMSYLIGGWIAIFK
ncbi:MAG: TetR/AcrR family transcriptional regulator [Eubacteriales bacterium]|nr:TetR/AcrR family transcriptional regulator [Eubacteriales bacterium]